MHDLSDVAPKDRILVALDTPDVDRAVRLAGELAGRVGGLKIGLELFVSTGPDGVARLRDEGLEIFLDLKLHDIPNTVAGAAAAAASLGVTYLTVHALGGDEMIRRGVEAANEGAAAAGHPAPILLAVTILTSHDEASLGRIGIAGPSADAVPRLTRLARDAGAGGVVCSPLEVASVRRVFPEGVLVVPGIRPRGAGPAGDDQARTAEPARAVRDGADRIVVGRPITGSDDPRAAAEAIVRELGS
jgi:orotidine-5'-phosphate decarboxylase